jgi:hypothetical protein
MRNRVGGGCTAGAPGAPGRRAATRTQRGRGARAERGSALHSRDARRPPRLQTRTPFRGRNGPRVASPHGVARWGASPLAPQRGKRAGARAAVAKCTRLQPRTPPPRRPRGAAPRRGRKAAETRERSEARRFIAETRGALPGCRLARPSAGATGPASRTGTCRGPHDPGLVAQARRGGVCIAVPRRTASQPHSQSPRGRLGRTSCAPGARASVGRATPGRLTPKPGPPAPDAPVPAPV